MDLRSEVEIERVAAGIDPASAAAAAAAFAHAVKTDWRALAARAAAGDRGESAGLSAPDAALCEYAEALTRAPGACGAATAAALRAAGFSDTAIHDATQSIAYFNYINRVADGLGVDLEPEMRDLRRSA
ncbi:MAG: hypothetical protein K8T90_07665 [Planctomycetes bacterium]|nr:hypothetical protein [Planctomycetota bacterium]